VVAITGAATLPDEAPTRGSFRDGKPLPWWQARFDATVVGLPNCRQLLPDGLLRV